jgi:glycerol kinase
MTKFILGIDQGTSRTKSVVFDQKGNQVTLGVQGVVSLYPKPGWVEQDPRDIWRATETSFKKAFADKVSASNIQAIGIADQGETVIVWDSNTGKPLYNAILWQCRRTSPICEKLKEKGYEGKIREKTGLLIDPYFSATKLRWILDNVDGTRTMAEEGRALFGTTDTWLIWNLTKGRTFATDYSTASRTMMLNIHSLKWDTEILDWLNIPETMLPKLVNNSCIVGYTDPQMFEGEEVPIAGVIVDQQGALFGHTCFQPGEVKNSYGTGCFTLMNTGKHPKVSNHGLLTTIAWVLDGVRNYALDGGVYIAGGAVQWLKDGLGIISEPSDTERMAQSVEDNGGIYFVPAFVGLAAPYWDPYARGVIVGITGGIKKEHIARATLEAMAYRTKEVVECMEMDSKNRINTLNVDGGASNNSFLMQFQSDILGTTISVPDISEVTALGAAYLAGIGIDYWDGLDNLRNLERKKNIFIPRMTRTKRRTLFENWKRAVERASNWESKQTL